MAERGWSDAQWSAITTRGCNVLVSAGAGSGKTTVLIERIMRLLLETPRLDVNRLLVATFTEAAAAEMRQRLEMGLRRRLEQAESVGDLEATTHISMQISLLDVAQISTLHSFCLTVVRRNFLTLGLDPDFRLVGEDESKLLREGLVGDIIERRLLADDGSFRQMLDYFGALHPESLHPLILRMDEFSRSQPDPEAWLSEVEERFRSSASKQFLELEWATWFFKWVLRQLDESRSLFLEGRQIAFNVGELTGYEENLSRLLDHVEQAIDKLNKRCVTGEITQSLRAACSEKSPRAKAHPMRDLVKDCRSKGIANLKEVLTLFERGEEALLGDIYRLTPAVGALVDVVQEFQVTYASVKRSRGTLDFSDLEHFALQALTDECIGEAGRLREQFEEIFVDEYQDTSPIQDALIQAIARPEGNVFIVGDVKQSIYRFRMAEPNIFLDKYLQFGRSEQGCVISLSANYRSRHTVVNAVNYIFSQLMSLELGGINFDETARMLPGAAYPEAGQLPVLDNPVEVHLIERSDHQAQSATLLSDATDAAPVDETERSADESGLDTADTSAIEKEALVIARRIEDWMGRSESGAHARYVWDKELREYRPLQYRDIVVLLRSVKGRMNSILEVFRAQGIPAYGATSTGFFESLEVQWMMAALGAIDNPRREVDLVALMRSPLGSFSDEDLAHIRLHGSGNFYDALQNAAKIAGQNCENGTLAGNSVASAAPMSSGSLEERCRSFLSRLQEWRMMARRSPAAEVIRAIYRHTGFVDFAFGMSGGDVRKANLHLLLEKARAFDKTSLEGAFGFAAWLKGSVMHDVDTGEARTLGEREDVVRVMTIHQSKGLEFPVVFVADIGKLFYEDSLERSLPMHRMLGFGPELVDLQTDQRWSTIVSISTQEANQTESRAEEARVLYVALTRAREQLVLVGSVRGLERTVARTAATSDLSTVSLPVSKLMNSKSYLEWLLPTLLRHRHGQVLREIVGDGEWQWGRIPNLWDDSSSFTVSLWNHPLGNPLPRIEQSTGSSGEDLDDYGSLELDEPDTSEEIAVTTMLNVTAEIPSKVSATDLRRLWVAKSRGFGRADKVGRLGAAERLLRNPKFAHVQESTGRESGIAFHAVMQRLNFQQVKSTKCIHAELAQMVNNNVLSREIATMVDVNDIMTFVNSPVGQRVIRAKRVYREQPFFCRIPIATNPRSLDSFVIAQGVIDVLAEEDDGWLIVDYKTDQVDGDSVRTHSEEYTAQVATYIRAVQSIVGNRRVEGVLYFVRAQTAVPMRDLNLDGLWFRS